jgi:hypothetical protein
VPSLPSEAKEVVFPHVDIGRQIMTNAAAWMPGFPELAPHKRDEETKGQSLLMAVSFSLRRQGSTFLCSV